MFNAHLDRFIAASSVTRKERSSSFSSTGSNNSGTTHATTTTATTINALSSSTTASVLPIHAAAVPTTNLIGELGNDVGVRSAGAGFVGVGSLQKKRVSVDGATYST